jgi:hypothetical protein
MTGVRYPRLASVRATLSAYLDIHPEDEHELAPIFDLLDTGGDVTTSDVGRLQTAEVTGATWRNIDSLGDATLRRCIADALR